MTRALWTQISPSAPAGSGRPCASMIATVTSSMGRPTERRRVQLLGVLVGAAVEAVVIGPR